MSSVSAVATVFTVSTVSAVSTVFKVSIYLFIYFMALWYSKKLYLQAKPRVCEQPVFTAQQNYINYSYL